MRAHASTSCAACLWCLLVGLGAKPARAAPPTLDPAVSMRLQSALEHSLEYGEHDHEFLKNNFVEVRRSLRAQVAVWGALAVGPAGKSTAWMTAVSCHARHALILSRAVAQVRAGRYELYYSESVWTEQPEQTTITLLVTVTQYDMGARFKNFTPDSERPCVRILLPADCLSRDHCLTGEHHECGKSHFSFQYLGSRRNPPLLFHATLVGPQGEFITDSDTMTIEFVPLPWWRPLGLQSAPPATARTHHATPNSHHAPAALRVAFTFLANACTTHEIPARTRLQFKTSPKTFLQIITPTGAPCSVTVHLCLVEANVSLAHLPSLWHSRLGIFSTSQHIYRKLQGLSNYTLPCVPCPSVTDVKTETESTKPIPSGERAACPHIPTKRQLLKRTAATTG